MRPDRKTNPDDRLIRDALAGFRPPPEPDAERLWSGIADERQSASIQAAAASPRKRHVRIALVSVSLAAALAFAIVGRVRMSIPAGTTAARSAETLPVRSQSSRGVRSAAVEHVTDAQKVLLALAVAESGVTAAEARSLASDASNLLAGNRVVRSTAELSPALEALLKDLDLVFTQLAAAEQDVGEIHFAVMTVRERGVMGRMRRVHDAENAD